MINLAHVRTALLLADTENLPLTDLAAYRDGSVSIHAGNASGALHWAAELGGVVTHNTASSVTTSTSLGWLGAWGLHNPRPCPVFADAPMVPHLRDTLTLAELFNLPIKRLAAYSPGLISVDTGTIDNAALWAMALGGTVTVTPHEDVHVRVALPVWSPWLDVWTVLPDTTPAPMDVFG